MVIFHPTIVIDKGTAKVRKGKLLAKRDGNWIIIDSIDCSLRLVAMDKPISIREFNSPARSNTKGE